MDKYCVRCGCKLDFTNFGAYFCKNCGKLPENQENYESESKEDARYVG